MLRSVLLSASVLAGMAQPAFAEQGDWLVRLRAIAVAPTEDVGPIQPDLTAGSAEVDNAYVPELDFTYFFRDNLAVELILATSPHDLQGTGAIDALGEIADVMVLPPTVTLQYHFDAIGKARPYVGVGLNYTLFYNEDASDSLVNALGGPTSVNVDDSFGVAFQAGIDYDVGERWFINADIKYIQIDTEATLNTGGTVRTVDIDLDPIVAGIGVGMRF